MTDLKQLTDNAFTASNGVRILDLAEGIGFILPEQSDYSRFGITQAKADAIVEWGIAKRDTELGRWRYPENPDYVVKHDPLGVRIAHVLHEPSFAARVVRPSDAGVGLGSERDKEFLRAARAYFAAHPEPKPWRNAKAGEVWALGIGGGYHGDSIAVIETDEGLRFIWGVKGGHLRNIPITDREIDYGTRIWPEVAS